MKIIQVPVILFTDHASKHHFESLPSNFQMVVQKSYEDFQCVKSRKDYFWKKQFDLNAEKHIHKSWMLGAIWYEKKNFVLEAMQMRPKTQYFIWADIGIFRDSHGDDLRKDFPLFRNFGQHSEQYFQDGLFHILQIQPFGKNESRITDYNSIRPMSVRLGGGILGGNREAWILANDAQETMVDEMVQIGQCIFKDQYVWSNCVKTMPHIFYLEKTVPEHDWFALLYRWSREPKTESI